MTSKRDFRTMEDRLQEELEYDEIELEDEEELDQETKVWLEEQSRIYNGEEALQEQLDEEYKIWAEQCQ